MRAGVKRKAAHAGELIEAAPIAAGFPVYVLILCYALASFTFLKTGLNYIFEEHAMTYSKITAAIALTAALVSPLAYSQGLPRSQSAEGASVYFISPKDGDTVSSPVHVVFGLAGMGVAPAGLEKENTGHHHLLIDVDQVAFDMPVKLDDQHLHFGNGQTEAMVELTPGEHSLQLLLADHYHIPHKPVIISEKIKITVK